MEPLTTIELGTCKWIGIIALTCSAAAEILHLANGNSRTLPWANRETARRATSRRTSAR